MKLGFLAILIFSLVPMVSHAGVDLVVVDKSKRRMYLYDEGALVRKYDVALGSKPRGHKRRRGDGRTPEGRYYLDAKNENSSFYLSMHVSYPNKQDMENARKRGDDPGDEIMVHGQPNYFGWFSYVTQYFDWTNGCIALKNSDMEEFISLVEVGAVIDIRW